MAALAMCFVAATSLSVLGSVSAQALYDCDAELWDWEHLWTPDWKQWCCEHEQKGCPSTSTATATSTSSLTQTSTRTTTATTTGTQTATNMDPCDNVCVQENVNATCGARIVWASKHETKDEASPCEAAQELVSAQFSDLCSACTPVAAGCDTFSDRVQVMKKFERQEAGAPPRTLLVGFLCPLGLGLFLLVLLGFVLARRRADSRVASGGDVLTNEEARLWPEELLLASEGEV